MADLEKTVSIIFSGVDDASKTIHQVSKSLDTFEKGISDISAPLANVATSVLKVEAAFAALAAGGLAYAYAKSIQFEGATIELKKVIGDEIGLLGEAAAASLELSNQYGVSSSNVLASTAAFKQAGFSVEEAMQLTKNALDLVIAGDLEAAQASEILVAALKGFNAPASEAARLIDVLNAVSNEYGTNVEQLGIGMAALSPIANQMGFSFEETAGVITPIIEVFRSGDEAATALKTGLLKLVDDSKPVKDALASIGISQEDANGKLKSGKEILYEVSAAFQHLDPNQKSFVAQQLVGINQSARMITVFDNLGTSTDITAVAMKAAGSAAGEVVARLASGEVAVDRFKVGFENLAIAIGDRFRDAATGAISGATDIENSLAKLARGGAFDDLLNVVSQLSTDLGNFFVGIAEAMPEALKQVDWSGFTSSLQNLAGTIGDLFDAAFDGADVTTADGLADAIQRVIDAGTGLTNVTRGILEVFEPFIRAISNMVDTLGKADPETQEFIGNIGGIAIALTGTAGVVAALALATKGVSAFLGLFKGSGAAIRGMSTALGDASAGLGTFSSKLGTVGKLLGATAAGGLAFEVGYAAGEIIDEYVPAVGKGVYALIEWSDKLLNWSGTQKSANQVSKENTAFLEAQRAATDRATQSLENFEDTIDSEALKIRPELDLDAIETALINLDWTGFDIPPLDVTVQTAMDEDAFAGIEDFRKEIKAELEDNNVDLGIEVPDQEIDRAKRKIQQAFKQAAVAPVGIDVAVDGTSVGPAFQTGLTDFFKENPVKMDQVFDPSSLSDLFSALDKATDPSTIAQIRRAIDQAIDLQKKLAEAQSSYISGQAALLEQQWQMAYQTQIKSEQGGTISIDAQGLEPEMEAFMWKILKKIQVRANESGAEFLLAASS